MQQRPFTILIFNDDVATTKRLPALNAEPLVIEREPLSPFVLGAEDLQMSFLGGIHVEDGPVAESRCWPSTPCKTFDAALAAAPA